jgi:AcrR family transcriptional regulator
VVCVTVAKNRTRNPRGEGDRLRGEIVEAAAALIAEKGREALSLRSIARRAGVTAPAIYAHFGDLDQIVGDVVDSTFDVLTDYLWRGAQGYADPVARLRAICRAYVAFGRERPLEYAVLFSRTVERQPGGSQKTIDNMQGGAAFGLLLDAIRACIDSGASKSTTPVEDATTIWVALHGYVGLGAAVADFPWPPGDSLVDLLIDGLARLS